MRAFFMVLLLALALLSDQVVDTEKLKEAAQGGDVQAQYDLGFVYGQGIGLEPDAQKARYWWTQAAKAGHASAQGNLGVVLMAEGIYDEAYEWLARAAQQGNTLAMCHLAELYASGRGVKSDRDRARELASAGFEAGERRCQNVWYLYRLDNP